MSSKEKNYDRIYKGITKYQEIIKDHSYYNCDTIGKRLLGLNFTYDLDYLSDMIKICNLIKLKQNKLTPLSVEIIDYDYKQKGLSNYDDKLIYKGHQALEELIKSRRFSYRICNDLNIKIAERIPESQNNIIFYENINKMCNLIETDIMTKNISEIGDRFYNIKSFQLQEQKD